MKIKTLRRISGAVMAIAMFLGWGIAGNLDCGGDNIGAFVITAAIAILAGVVYAGCRGGQSE